MGCQNTKSAHGIIKKYSINFDDEDDDGPIQTSDNLIPPASLVYDASPEHQTKAPQQHGKANHLSPRHRSFQFDDTLSPNKLELIIDQESSNSSSHPMSYSTIIAPSSISLHSPILDYQKILLNKDDFIIESLLQEGAIGKVYVAKNKINQQHYALKFFGYTPIDPEERDIEREISVMNSFQGIHGIVQMIGYFYDTPTGIIPNKVYCNPYPVIVMELLTGGELFDTIHRIPNITEFILSKIFYQMILSVQSIHQKKYIHRDIKLENMMFSSKVDGVIKIIDFGLMVKVTESDGMYHDDYVVGTPGYLAPEVLDYYDYSYASDIWSLGCCLYSMLSGLLPFNPPSKQESMHHRYRPMTGHAWVNISLEAKDLVKQLLQRSSHARWSLEQALTHPWLVSAPTNDLGEEYLSRMKYLAIKQKMKSFFLNSNQIIDSNRKTRDQLKKLIPILRKESSLLSRSSSSGSISATPSPISKRPGYFHSNSTLASHSPQKKAAPTPPTLKSAQKHKSTPPGDSSPYINEKFSTQSKPPPRPTSLLQSALRGTPPPTSEQRSPSIKSSHSLDFLGRVPQSENSSPVKPIKQMTENELQSRLQSFKRSVLSSLLKSTSNRSILSNDASSASQNHSQGHYTINKETFLCLMLDAGLPELASSRVFHIFDTDHNGVLDIKEFLLTMLAFQSRGPRNKKEKLYPQHRKFHRSRHVQSRRSTLDDIDEIKTDVLEVASPRPLSSLVYQDIMNSSPPKSPPTPVGSITDNSLPKSELSDIVLPDSECFSYPNSANASPEKMTTKDENHQEDGNGEINDEDQLARFYFDIFDLDGNGSIEKDELRVAVNAFFLDEISSPDPSIGYTPMVNGGSFCIRSPTPIDDHITQDGQQSLPRSNSHRPEASKDIEELFHTIDSNGTGKITFDEFKIFFKKLRRSQSDSTDDSSIAS